MDMCTELNKDIKFYKEQIRYCQNLLEDAIHKRNKLLNKILANSDLKLKTKELNESCIFDQKKKISKQQAKVNDSNMVELDHITAKENEIANQNMLENNEDDRRVLMKMINPDIRKGLKLAEQECDKIRNYEKELIDKNIAPLEAKKMAREKFYPASIPHNNQSTDEKYTQAIPKLNNNTNKYINSNTVEDATNALFENNLVHIVEQNIEDGNDVLGEDILEEKIVLEVC